MDVNIDKLSRIVLIQLRDSLLSSTQRLSDALPDFSVDVSEIKLPENTGISIGPIIYYLWQKNYIEISGRGVVITPRGIESLEPFFRRRSEQKLLLVFSGSLGILGTIIGLILGKLMGK